MSHLEEDDSNKEESEDDHHNQPIIDLSSSNNLSSDSENASMQENMNQHFSKKWCQERVKLLQE